MEEAEHRRIAASRGPRAGLFERGSRAAARVVSRSAVVTLAGSHVAALLGGAARSLSGREALDDTVASEHASVD